MEKPAETTSPKEKHSTFLPGFIVWPVVILLLYVLSSGPVMMMVAKRRISPDNKFMLMVYSPLGWAMEETPLDKPMKIYYHLWAPTLFDKNGDVCGYP